MVPLLALVGVAIVLAADYLARPSGPLDKGKPVKYWVDDCLRKPSNTFSSRDAEFLPLLAIGSNAVPYLIHAIQHEPGFLGSSVYRSIYQSLPGMVSKALPAPLVGDTVRLRAYVSLASLGPAAKAAVPFLMEQFQPNNRELGSVAFTLGAIGPSAGEAVPLLTNAFHSTNSAFRRTAARALATIAPDYPPLLPDMLIDLKSADVVVRRDACHVLGRLGPRAKSGVVELRKAKEDKDREVREKATWALREIEGEEEARFPFSIYR
jgi:HEAT repeats